MNLTTPEHFLMTSSGLVTSADRIAVIESDSFSFLEILTDVFFDRVAQKVENSVPTHAELSEHSERMFEKI